MLCKNTIGFNLSLIVKMQGKVWQSNSVKLHINYHSKTVISLKMAPQTFTKFSSLKKGRFYKSTLQKIRKYITALTKIQNEEIRAFQIMHISYAQNLRLVDDGDSTISQETRL